MISWLICQRVSWNGENKTIIIDCFCTCNVLILFAWKGHQKNRFHKWKIYSYSKRPPLSYYPVTWSPQKVAKVEPLLKILVYIFVHSISAHLPPPFWRDGKWYRWGTNYFLHCSGCGGCVNWSPLRGGWGLQSHFITPPLPTTLHPAALTPSSTGFCLAVL